MDLCISQNVPNSNYMQCRCVIGQSSHNLKYHPLSLNWWGWGWHYHGPNERLHLLYPKSQNLSFQLKCSYIMVQVDHLSKLKKDQIFPILKGVYYEVNATALAEIWTWPADSVFFINSQYSTHISSYMSSNRNSSIFTPISIFWFKR